MLGAPAPFDPQPLHKLVISLLTRALKGPNAPESAGAHCKVQRLGGGGGGGTSSCLDKGVKFSSSLSSTESLRFRVGFGVFRVCDLYIYIYMLKMVQG